MAKDEGPLQTLRVVYEYDRHGIRPVARQIVDMVPPEQKTEVPTSGLNYTLLNRNDKTLFTGSMRDPVRRDTEAFSNDASQNIHRVPLEDPHGHFEVLVPHYAEGHSIALSRPGPEGPLAHHFTAVPAVRNRLDDIPLLAEPKHG